jgi:hypothetical protein
LHQFTSYAFNEQQDVSNVSTMGKSNIVHPIRTEVFKPMMDRSSAQTPKQSPYAAV